MRLDPSPFYGEGGQIPHGHYRTGVAMIDLQNLGVVGQLLEDFGGWLFWIPNRLN